MENNKINNGYLPSPDIVTGSLVHEVLGGIENKSDPVFVSGGGWIKLHRKMLDNPLITKDAEHFYIWAWILLNATHTETKGYFGGKIIVLLQGQLITGRKKMSKELKCSEHKIQRVLKCFEIAQQITQRTDMQSRLITINNWSQYQEYAQRNAQRLHNECTTTAHITRRKEGKKESTPAKEIFSPTRNVPAPEEEKNSAKKEEEVLNIYGEHWSNYVEHRKNMKKPMSEKAKELTMLELSKFSVDIAKNALDQSIMHGWIGVFPEKVDQKSKTILYPKL
jgi:hypothetical protein